MNVNLNPLFLWLSKGSHRNNMLPFANIKIGSTNFQGKDAYIKNKEISDIYQLYGIGSQKKTNNYIPREMMDSINNYSTLVTQYGDCFEYKGKEYHISQLPPVQGELLHEVKAEHNVMDFGENHYFKYVSPDGKEHFLFSVC